jgi:uncharacterized protein YifN (PemK superfamily)
MAFPTDEELAQAGWIKISRRQRLILSRARFQQAYWVDFPHDAYAPEFVGEHPGVVIRSAGNLNEPCVVVPLTSRDQGARPHTYKLAHNPNPRSKGDCWAVCDHLYTVSLGRLRPFLDRFKQNSYPKVTDLDMYEITKKVKAALDSLHVCATNPPASDAMPAAPQPPQERPPGARPILTLKTEGPAS